MKLCRQHDTRMKEGPRLVLKKKRTLFSRNSVVMYLFVLSVEPVTFWLRWHLHALLVDHRHSVCVRELIAKYLGGRFMFEGCSLGRREVLGSQSRSIFTLEMERNEGPSSSGSRKCAEGGHETWNLYGRLWWPSFSLTNFTGMSGGEEVMPPLGSPTSSHALMPIKISDTGYF